MADTAYGGLESRATLTELYPSARPVSNQVPTNTLVSFPPFLSNLYFCPQTTSWDQPDPLHAYDSYLLRDSERDKRDSNDGKLNLNTQVGLSPVLKSPVLTPIESLHVRVLVRVCMRACCMFEPLDTHPLKPRYLGTDYTSL
jgi:hypothetical protein